jgi:hypothetical protein
MKKKIFFTAGIALMVIGAAQIGTGKDALDYPPHGPAGYRNPSPPPPRMHRDRIRYYEGFITVVTGMETGIVPDMKTAHGISLGNPECPGSEAVMGHHLIVILRHIAIEPIVERSGTLTVPRSRYVR